MHPQHSSFAFLSNPVVVVHVSHNRKTIPKTTNSITSNDIAIRRNTVSSSRLYVFDFFKKRAEEGLDQLSNIADSASKGKLGEGLMNAATYTQQTNQVSLLIILVKITTSINRFIYRGVFHYFDFSRHLLMDWRRVVISSCIIWRIW